MSQPNIEKEAGPPAQTDTPIEEAPANEKRVREYKEFGHDEVKPTRMCSRLIYACLRTGLTSAPPDANVDMSRVRFVLFFSPQVAYTYISLTGNST